MLLEAVKTLGTIRRFLHVSTDEVYGESSYELDKANVEAGEPSQGRPEHTRVLPVSQLLNVSTVEGDGCLEWLRLCTTAYFVVTLRTSEGRLECGFGCPQRRLELS